LESLEERGELLRVDADVNPRYELGAYLWETASGPAVLFEHVKGSEFRAFGNLLNSRERIARALGTSVQNLHDVLAGAVASRYPPTTVAEASAARAVLDPPSWSRLPVPRFFEGEDGAYVTAGVIVAKGGTGKRNVSFARLKILSGTTAFIGIAPTHHLAALAHEAACEGRVLEVAVAIGNHPAVLLAAAYYLGLGDDEFEVAGALLGEPLELTKCETIDLEVPAQAEIVVECVLDPQSEVNEGLVSEFSGLFHDYGAGPVLTTRCMTRRDDALFQVILPGYSSEHVLVGAVAIAAVLEERLRSAVPTVAEVAVTPGGCGRMHAVVSLHEAKPGDAEQVILGVLNTVHLVKLVTVVDDDIDVNEPVDVEWALATRMRADRDVLLLPDMPTARADPLGTEGRIGKMGIDATRKSRDRSTWEVARPPSQALEAARAALQRMETAAGKRGSATFAQNRPGQRG
jgi:4-hydroxy-3-polyprenylbenzoate decarboxylase